MVLRIISLFAGFLFVGTLYADTDMQWLDNRFRVDPAIKRITFIIQREEPSQSAILVRPDGGKYYASRHPEYIEWYQGDDVDIVSVEQPMPGPWQAIGKVSKQNRIQLISNISMQVDHFPARLYSSEVIKFTVSLLKDGKPLTNRNFLQHVQLQVVFTAEYDSSDIYPDYAEPAPQVVAQFLDDGVGLDEKAGDGVFTAALPVDVSPGRYRVSIVSKNELFTRAQEQVVLVYPSPVMISFVQGRGQKEAHKVVVDGEVGSIHPGSLALHVEQVFPDGTVGVSQAQAYLDDMTLSARLENGQAPGRYTWRGWLYATDGFEQRELIFPLPEQHFAVQGALRLDRNLAEFRAAEERRQKEAELQYQAELAAQARRKFFIKMVLGNLILMALGGGLAWWFRRQKRALS
ncbi:TIGR03503 family protein [Thaumasiovibrio sp. DFM-14]|uniref:TIGR03503 family protein n=1 Tax=Thaumasiovibrio sp. DFM-14 TaxID=3384792 RepID=UPI0039A28C3C